jgi:hypothetical protein
VPNPRHPDRRASARSSLKAAFFTDDEFNSVDTLTGRFTS